MGLVPWFRRQGWGRGRVEWVRAVAALMGYISFEILILIYDDKVRDELGRSRRRLLIHGDANH